MIIKGQEIPLTFKTRQMIQVGDKIGGKYDIEFGAYKNDLKVLATLISVFADTNYEHALDIIDEALEEGKTVKGMYEEIFNEMNKKAFFTEKLEVLDTPPVDMEKMTQDMMKQAQEQMSKEVVTQTITENTLKNSKK